MEKFRFSSIYMVNLLNEIRQRTNTFPKKLTSKKEIEWHIKGKVVIRVQNYNNLTNLSSLESYAFRFKMIKTLILFLSKLRH